MDFESIKTFCLSLESLPAVKINPHAYGKLKWAQVKDTAGSNISGRVLKRSFGWTADIVGGLLRRQTKSLSKDSRVIAGVRNT